MARNAKIWAGIAMSAAIVLLFLAQRDTEDKRMQAVWQEKYRHTQRRIGWQLVHLRHEYARQPIQTSTSILLEIKQLWIEKDILTHLIRSAQSRFPADSLMKLERLITQKAPTAAVVREIERIEKINANH